MSIRKGTRLGQFWPAPTRRPPRARGVGGLAGRTFEGKQPKAVFSIGLCVGEKTPNAILKRPGACLAPEQAKKELLAARKRQVHAAGATLTSAVGLFEGAEENTIVAEIRYFENPKERTSARWKENMLALGEQLADRLGQKEIQVELEDGTYRLSAPNKRGPKLWGKSGRRIK